MGYKVGDRVKVREDIEVGKYDGESFLEEMLQWRGKVITITSITCTGRYSCNENYWSWTDGMLAEKIEDEITANEAWDLAECIFCMNEEKRKDIFGTDLFSVILGNNLPNEAKAKIESWEREKDFKTGNIVKLCSDGTKGIIMDYWDGSTNSFAVYTENGCIECWGRFRIKRTGNSINLAALLRQFS